MPLMQTMFQPLMTIDQIKANAGEERFRLKATGGGFFAKLFGMAKYAVITWDSHGFRLKRTAFGVEEDTYIPRSRIASTVCITMKPVPLLVLGLVTLPMLGLGLVFLIAYFFAKRQVIIGVVSSGGTIESVKLKVHPDTLDEIYDGMKLLENLIRDESAPAAEEDDEPRYVARSAAPPPPPPRSRAAAEASIATCPSCGARMSIPASAAGRKVRCSSCREVFTPAADE